MPVQRDPDTPLGADNAPVITTYPYRWSQWVTPVLDTNAYTAGDALHVAPLRFSGILRAPSYTTTAVGLVVEDSTSTPQNIGLTLWLFDRPEITTPSLNGAWTMVAADREALVACIPSGPYNTSTATGLSTRYDIRVPLRNRRERDSLWCVLQTLGAPTYTASSLRVQLIVQD